MPDPKNKEKYTNERKLHGPYSNSHYPTRVHKNIEELTDSLATSLGYGGPGLASELPCDKGIAFQAHGFEKAQTAVQHSSVDIWSWVRWEILIPQLFI